MAHLLICYSLQYITFHSTLLPSTHAIVFRYSCQSWMSLKFTHIFVRISIFFPSSFCFVLFCFFFCFIVLMSVPWNVCLCVCCQTFLLRFNKFQFKYHTSFIYTYYIILYIHFLDANPNLFIFSRNVYNVLRMLCL